MNFTEIIEDLATPKGKEMVKAMYIEQLQIVGRYKKDLKEAEVKQDIYELLVKAVEERMKQKAIQGGEKPRST